MAIRNNILGASDLRLAADVVKPNYAIGRTIGGSAGEVMGHWRATWIRLPASGLTLNGTYVLMGRDANGTINFNSSNDTALRLGGDAAGQGVGRMRPIVAYRQGNTNAFSGGFAGEGRIQVASQMARSTNYLIVEGVSNVGTNASPVWKGWGAVCAVAGTPESYVAATNINATWISGTTATLLRQIFTAGASSNSRTPVGVQLEHVAIVQGDFPWDTVSNRPHHDAIRALAGSSGVDPLTYATLVAAQNAGTLPYANCDQGKGNLEYWWPLTSLSAGLANTGSVSGANLTANPNAAGLADDSAIAPAHWQGGAPTITEPRLRFFGGRGARAVSIEGTHSANVRRRWLVEATDAVLPGFDWATLTVTADAWATNDVLPVGGPYRLEIEDAADDSLAASINDILVGTIALTHGQSGMELAFRRGSDLGVNYVSAAVAAGAQGMVMTLGNEKGGTTAAYAQPTVLTQRLRAGETPVAGHGAVLMNNEWAAQNPGHPLLIVNMAISGTRMDDWAADATLEGEAGHASWTYLGAVQPPGVSSGGGSGVVGFYAWALGQYVDAHLLMWHPNMSMTPEGRAAYVAANIARFAESPLAPWVIFPPWRHRRTSIGSDSIDNRVRHIAMVTELGELGHLGPHYADPVMGGLNDGHSAFNTSAGNPSTTEPVSDANHVGQGRLGRSMGRALARVWNPAVKDRMMVLSAWWRDAAVRDVIEVELGRAARTLNGAAQRTNAWWVSTDNGVTWSNAGFSVALDSTATRAVLTKSSGGWPAADVRVDYARDWVNNPVENPDEATVEAALDGLLYDNQAYRGRINLASPAGNVLQGTNRTGAGVAGVAVAARGAAKLVASERWTGARSVTVRMLAADGVTVLRERTLSLTGS